MEKWYFIAMALMFGFVSLGIAYSERQKVQCKIAAIQAQVPADDIVKMCE